jgi:hypothetical protein
VIFPRYEDKITGLAINCIAVTSDGLFSPNHNPDLDLVDFALQTNLFNQDQHTS